MTHASDQLEAERNVFEDFLSLRKFEHSDVHYESRNPPEPDILCTFPHGERIAFELGEICDPVIAEALNRRDTKTGQRILTSDPSSERVLSKLEKPYESDFPIELLLYWAGRTITPDDVVLPTIEPILNSRDHVFQKVWYLGEHELVLVYESP